MGYRRPAGAALVSGATQQTRSICAHYKAQRGSGDDQSVVIANLAEMFGVLRPAIRRHLRLGGIDLSDNARNLGQADGKQDDVPPSREAVRAFDRPSSIPASSEPCPRCGVRADVGCKHQPAVGPAPPAIARADYEKRDGRKNGLQGLLSHHQDRLARNLEPARKALAGGSRDD